MSHVDDGTLHAYLDGELSALEVARLEGHLTECAPCRARLAEEKDVVVRAGRILALAEPPAPGRTAPPLHQLRHTRLQWRVRVPLAWAASLVLVAGATWFALKPGVVPAPGALETDAFALAPVDSVPAQPAAPATPGAAPPAEAERQPPTPQEQRLDETARGIAPLADSVAPAPQPARPSIDSGRQLAALRASRDSTANVTVDGVQIRGAAPTAAVAAERPIAAAAAADLYGYSADPVQLDSARAALGTAVLAIDQVPITSVRRLGPGAVLVEQRLPSGEVIQLRQQVSVAGKSSVTMQEGPQQIAGRVTNAASGTPVSGAEVIAPGTALRTVTDERGAFAMDSVAPGTYRLQARMIGYEMGDLSAARVDSGRTTRVDFALRPSPVALSEVVVTGASERAGRARREAAPPAAAAAPPEPVPALWRQVGRLRVDIVGPLPADSLRRLLDAVRPVR